MCSLPSPFYTAFCCSLYSLLLRPPSFPPTAAAMFDLGSTEMSPRRGGRSQRSQVSRAEMRRQSVILRSSATYAQLREALSQVFSAYSSTQVGPHAAMLYALLAHHDHDWRVLAFRVPQGTPFPLHCLLH